MSDYVTIRRADLAEAALRYCAAEAIWNSEYERCQPADVAAFDERLNFASDAMNDAKEKLILAARALYITTLSERAARQPPTPSNGSEPEAVPF